jgi:septal ring factor EnvC (AmiA/AmiB activator)
MSSRPPLDEAVQRLVAALEAFEAAVQRRRAHEETVRELEEDVQLLATDRADLARRLDETTARVRDLASANAESVRRLDAAMDSIRDILEKKG